MFDLLIYFIYIFMYISSIGMITSYNPIFSILFMVNILILIALNLILLDIAYLGLIFIMIYVGAIVILFLFIIMMIPLKKVTYSSTVYLAISFYFLFFLFFFILKYLNKFTLFSNNYFINIKNKTHTLFDSNSFIIFEEINNFNLLRIGNMLFNNYYLFVIIAGLILLVVMIGSIFLTNEQQGKFIRKQLNTTNRFNIINFHNRFF